MTTSLRMYKLLELSKYYLLLLYYDYASNIDLEIYEQANHTFFVKVKFQRIGRIFLLT